MPEPIHSNESTEWTAGDNVTLTFTDVEGDYTQVTVAASGASGAPTDVDYLVGTASGSLSAEIVVGTSPGGELGGTWASPTVDTTHSGSSHAGAVTFENLDANADVGTGATQVAAGNHTHAGGSGHTIQDDDVSLTARTKLSFQDGFALNDDAVGDQTEVDLSYEATPSTQAFGDAASAGTAITATRGDHKHAMPANPVTAHEATYAHGDIAGHIADPAAAHAASAVSVDSTTLVGTGTDAQAVFEEMDNDIAGLDSAVSGIQTTNVLVGTATAAFTGEIVVGTTPGGELGGTWASPTVDATHSGSAHSSFRAKADIVNSITFTKSGNLSTGTGATRWYNDTGGNITLQSARGSVGTAPLNQSILVDVNNNGTSVWNATQANRITIAASTNTDEGGAFDDATIADGEYITVDIDQVGTGTVGADLTVTIWWTA